MSAPSPEIDECVDARVDSVTSETSNMFDGGSFDELAPPMDFRTDESETSSSAERSSFMTTESVSAECIYFRKVNDGAVAGDDEDNENLDWFTAPTGETGELAV